MKLDKAIKKPVDTMTGEDFWSIFFAYGADSKYMNLLDKMIAAKEEIKMAKELLQTISRDENERARFRARRKFQMDMEHSLIVARDEGEVAKATMIAKNLLEMDLPIEQISKATGLAREKIERLHKTE